MSVRVSFTAAVVVVGTLFVVACGQTTSPTLPTSVSVASSVAGTRATVAVTAPSKVTRQFVTTQLMLRFKSIVESTFENIAVTGTVHIVTHVLIEGDSTSVEVHTNFLDTTGIGLSTGATFRGFSTPTSITQAINLEEGSLEFIIANSGALLKGDIKKDITLLSDLLLRLKFDKFGTLIAASVEPVLHCIEC